MTVTDEEERREQEYKVREGSANSMWPAAAQPAPTLSGRWGSEPARLHKPLM